MTHPYPTPPFEAQSQDYPGTFTSMKPVPDHGEKDYQGHGRLSGKVALITGADSGIGRAVAIAFAREGADVVLSYLAETEDAKDTVKVCKQSGKDAIAIAGDIADPAHCRELVEATIKRFGKLHVVVNNAAFQKEAKSLADIADEDWQRHYNVNIHAMFYILRAAEPHLKPGASVINTASINAKRPPTAQLAYSSTKGAITNFTTGLAGLWAEKGIRVNAVLPGPIWTPLIPSTMEPEEYRDFGSQVPLQRPGQPVELAGAYVYLASDESSYTTGAMIAVAGGAPNL
ncbi:glucose 1-dehydrogenase [Dyella jejuensis]|uniref:Glucose 1-dehydrogenase n=2 Tax=Dyella jejuensis TaxID=1432009 RepID=A0ABW8JGM4_9GAMM